MGGIRGRRRLRVFIAAPFVLCGWIQEVTNGLKKVTIQGTDGDCHLFKGSANRRTLSFDFFGEMSYLPYMFCSIINDCRDANAAGRQMSRAIALLGCPASFIGVQSDLEAAGNLIDVLDAAEGRKGVVVVNVAPRNGRGKGWPNGTPLGYFWYKDTLVLASVDGFTLSLANKFGILTEVQILEIPEEYAKSQFRSFEFLPRAAKTLLAGELLKGEQFSFTILEAPKAIWWIDNFGNCKTTLLPEDRGFAVGQAVETKVGEFRCFEGLKDVPDGEIGMVIGSSGLQEKRFLEIVKQGGSAAEQLGISSGAVIY